MGHSSLNVSLTYLRGLEVAELNEEDMLVFNKSLCIPPCFQIESSGVKSENSRLKESLKYHAKTPLYEVEDQNKA